LGGAFPRPLSRLLPATLGYDVPQRGEVIFSSNKIDLQTELALKPRTEADSMPSPLGQGQTDTPIAEANRGEASR